MINQENDIAILLCTYNGEKYLRPQLNSIISQSYENWSIHVSDDGSSDGTISLLKEYRQLLGERKMKIYEGPKRGFSANFLSLVKKLDIKSSYYAFSDQDDIWHRDKLAKAINSPAFLDPRKPGLYCSRTTYVDNNLDVIGFSPLFKKAPSFQNALVQSIAGGNTMVMNAAFRKFLAATDTNRKIISHDWWCYLLITALEGTVFYDPTPTLKYRQHEENLVGSNSSIRDRLNRLRKLLEGTFSEWNTSNLILLSDFSHLIPRSNMKTLELFENSRSSSLLNRIALAKSSGIYRQTLPGNIGLLIAYLLKKV